MQLGDQLSGASTPQVSRSAGVLVERPVSELREHPTYTDLQLTVCPAQLAAIQDLGEFAFKDPLLITREGVIIDGYARKEVADRLGISTLSCVELDIDEDEALRLILSKHRRSSGWNDYSRIRMASRLKDVFRKRALANQEAGGRFKGRSKLTEANVRKEIATAAGVSVGNVTKVDQLRNADPELLKALASGEIRIHRAWLWRALAWPQQKEQLRLHRIQRCLKQKARALVSKHRPQGPANASRAPFTVADLGQLAQRLSAIHSGEAEASEPITIGLINVPGKTILLTKELYQAVSSQ